MQPCVVITNSCQSIPSDIIIKGVLDVPSLPEPLCVLPGEVRGYPWHITTKYYEADIHLCSLDRKTIGSQAFADSVNALIIPFDPSSIDGLSVVEQWLSFTKEFEAEVKILICDHCDSEDGPHLSSTSSIGLSRLEVQSWCVENGFELVELNPVENEEDIEIEDDFPESTGIKRVIQALHAHIWPNLEVKDPRITPIPSLQRALNGLNNSHQTENNRSLLPSDNKNSNGDTFSLHTSETNNRVKLVAEVKPLPKEKSSPKPPTNVAIVNPTVISPAQPLSVPSTSTTDQPSTRESGEELATSASTSEHQTSPPSSDTTIPSKPSPTKDERLAMLEAVESMPDESFEALFQNLNAMKTKAESLSPSQRKAYAEQMAVAFWRSIGGNDSEVEGISGDDSSDAD